jgi:hypothetical protein
MKKRGRILRDTSQGSGLISIDGKQFDFQLEKQWRSDTAPVINKLIDAELNNDGELVAVYLVDDNQIAKEQAEAALKTAKEKGTLIFNSVAAKTGKDVLIATAVVAVGWFFFNVVTINISQGLSQGITFWQLLSLLNASGNIINMPNTAAGTGLYGFAAIVCLAAIFVDQFWKHPTAKLGKCLPLVIMFFVAVKVYFGIHDGLAQASAAAGGNEMATAMMDQIMNQAMKAISIGVGFYLSMIGGIYLGFLGVKNYLVAKA